MAATVGLGVGIPLGVALVAALAILGWQIRKLKRRQQGASDGQPGLQGYYAPQPDANYAAPTPVVELGVPEKTGKGHEMPAGYPHQY